MPEDKVIGIIGRLAEVKGHDTLIRAMPAVLAKEPKARLLIVGDGPQRPALNQRLHELGLLGHVTFTGQISNVGAALRAIDVVAMPSLREGLPYALLEAMALDRPVVASAVGGLAETINHCENGVLFRVGDAQALAKALLSVLGDTDLKQTIVRGSRNTVEDFDIARHVDRLVAMYNALADGHPIPPAPVYQPVAVPWPTPALPGDAGGTASPVTVETGADQK
jgi:glycosyltransferase involved in cell wall biosynthesis